MVFVYQKNTAAFEINVFIFTQKLNLSGPLTSWKSLKKMPSLAYTERNQTKFFLLFLYLILFGHRKMYRHADHLAGQLQTIR